MQDIRFLSGISFLQSKMRLLSPLALFATSDKPLSNQGAIHLAVRMDLCESHILMQSLYQYHKYGHHKRPTGRAAGWFWFIGELPLQSSHLSTVIDIPPQSCFGYALFQTIFALLSFASIHGNSPPIVLFHSILNNYFVVLVLLRAWSLWGSRFDNAAILLLALFIIYASVVLSLLVYGEIIARSECQSVSETYTLTFKKDNPNVLPEVFRTCVTVIPGTCLSILISTKYSVNPCSHLIDYLVSETYLSCVSLVLIAVTADALPSSGQYGYQGLHLHHNIYVVALLTFLLV